MATTKKANDAELRVEVNPAGPDVSLTERIHRALPLHKGLREFASERTRLLDVQILHEDEKSARDQIPSLLRAAVYDYASSRPLILEGDVDAPERATVTPSAYQPLPTAE